MDEQSRELSRSLVFVVRVVTTIWLLVFVCSLVWHFTHGYARGKARLKDDIFAGVLCRDNPELRERWSECTKYQSVGPMHPWSAAWRHMAEHVNLCGPTTCREALDMIIQPLVGAIGTMGAMFLGGAIVVLLIIRFGLNANGPLYVGGDSRQRVQGGRFVEELDTPRVASWVERASPLIRRRITGEE